LLCKISIVDLEMSKKQVVNDFDSWIRFYKDRRQSTLRMRPTDGALLVMDSKEPSKVSREFPMRRGYDLISLFQQRRHIDQATATLESIQTARQEKKDLALEEIHRIEKELLAKVEERRVTNDPVSRIEITRKVGELQKELAAASDAFEKVVVPICYSVEMEHNEKLMNMIQSFPYTFEERSIPIAKKKA
jgi:hypothetical protein